MSGTVQTTLEVQTGDIDKSEPSEDEKTCPHDWCPRNIHKNAWPSHVKSCTPPEGWDDDGGFGE